MKNTANKISILLFAIVVLILLVGCPMPPSELPVDPGFESDGTVGIDNKLFLADEEDPSIVTFETNDPVHWTNRGYTFWVLTDTSPKDFNSLDVTLNKISGNTAAGFGVVVNQHIDAAVGSIMLVLLINAEAEYVIGEVVNNKFTELIPWTSSSNLITGFNQANNVVLNYNSSTAAYTLILNGITETVFEDTQPPFHTNGYGGYVTVISHLDIFPQTPVIIRFTSGD